MEQAEAEQRELDRHEQGDGGAERGATGRAENVGIGQRVAQQSLERGAGQRQRGADGHRGDDARQAQLEHDRLGRRGPGHFGRPAEQAVANDRHRVADRDRHVSERNASHQREGERDQADRREQNGRWRSASSHAGRAAVRGRAATPALIELAWTIAIGPVPAVGGAMLGVGVDAPERAPPGPRQGEAPGG